MRRRKKDGIKLKDHYRVFMGPVCLLCIVWLGRRGCWGRPRPRRHRSHRSGRVSQLPPTPQLWVARGAPVVRPDQVVEVKVPRRGGQVGRHHLLLWELGRANGAGLCAGVSSAVIAPHCLTLLLLTLFHSSHFTLLRLYRFRLLSLVTFFVALFG